MLSGCKRPREETPDRVAINAGGTRFETTKSTLIGCSTYFERHFSENDDLVPEVFVDVDDDSFKVLLSCMRRRAALMPADADLFRRVLLDAEFLGCEFLLTEVKETVQRHSGQLPARAQDFDAKHGNLLSAFRSGVLPALFLHPPAVARGEIIHQLIPAGEYDRLDLVSQRSSDGPIVKRVIAYALIENKEDGERRIEPVVSHHLDEEYHMGASCTLASDFENELRKHPDETSLITLGVSRYPPTTLGHTARSVFEHKIVAEETAIVRAPGDGVSKSGDGISQRGDGQRLLDAIQTLGSKGYRAISTWTGKDDRVRILLERAAPQHAAAT